MRERTEKTVVTEGNETLQTENRLIENKATSLQTTQYLIYFFFGALNVFLVARFFLKLFDASTTNTFVDLVYGITGIFVAPFAGIFNNVVSQEIETGSIFESATLVAIIVYLVLAWGIVKLVQILSGNTQTE